METEVTVFLTEEDAKKFILFQKYFKMFNFLLEKKVFEQRGANITLSIDKYGVLHRISRQDTLYDMKSEFDNVNEKVL